MWMWEWEFNWGILGNVGDMRVRITERLDLM